ncbi:hypothetical protein KFL_009090040 [Klebsormidium nitens]|uniref:Trimethylguanosine synthase n=1 Tax=Klebsormidium nitens TaxID=105231 RepID=A0A1Y1IML3_KLENI|nr:hypothetical protein KFL_009090040 [Klebsormidium nitens]|eukprot:GAQ92044.1 hypothetical protein KFL_009090040 [Klebsormidium nitens]
MPMEERSAPAAPCFFTRVDLSDELGQRLMRLQKRRENRRESKGEAVSEWWDEGDFTVGNDGVSSQAEEEEEKEEFVLAPAEQELAAQMAAMGLPTNLGGGMKKQARTSKTKRRRDAKKIALSTPLAAAPSPAPSKLANPLQASDTTSFPEPVARTSDGSPWQPVWDSEYGAFYWCNTETLESQWEVPDGLETYAAALYAFERQEGSDAAVEPVEGVEINERPGLQDARGGNLEAPLIGGLFGVVRERSEGKVFNECSVHQPGSLNGGSRSNEGQGRDEANEVAGNGGSKNRHGTGPGGMRSRLEERSPAEGLSGNLKSFESIAGATRQETRPAVQSFELRGRPRPCGTHIRFGDESDASASMSENGAIENGSLGSKPVLRSDVKEEAIDMMEVDDPMDVDSYGGVEKRGRSWINRSEIGGAPVRVVGENEKGRALGKGGVLDNGKHSVPALERKSDVRGESAADVSEAVRQDVTAAQKATTADPEETTDVGRNGSSVFTDNAAVWKGESNASMEAVAEKRATGAFEGGALLRLETGGAVLDEKRATVLGDSLLEAARERLHKGTEPTADFAAESNGTYGTHAQATVVDGLIREAGPAVKMNATIVAEATANTEGTVEGEAASQLDAEGSDAPASLTIRRNSLDGLKAAQVEKLTSSATPPLTSPEPSMVERKGSTYRVTSLPEPEASVLLKSEGARTTASVLTSAPAPRADVGAGGDAGGAVLVASASGREKPADVGQKYWFQRYRLFSKFDQGVRLDPEGWYSVTPEAIAVHHAKRCARRVVIDAFAGVGGNAIQMATTADWVIAVDLDPGRLALAEHNAGVYGVRDKIEFVAGDFLRLAPTLRADALFLSPPWGGPEYSLVETYDLDTMLEPVSGVELFKAALQVTSNIALFLPRNVDVKQLQELAWLASPPLPCEIESNYLCGKLKCITAYYGDLVVPPSQDR